MRAYIYPCNKNIPSMVTREYKTGKNMMNYFLRYLLPGDYHVQAFYNWDNRYKKPDIDVYVTVTENKKVLLLG